MDALRTLTSALGHYDPDAADSSPQANYRKAVRLTAQLGSLVATIGRVNAGGGPIAAGSGARPRREFPLHADRRAPERPRDARLRRGAHPPRGSRAQRVDLCRPRRGRDADRSSTRRSSARSATLKGPLHGGANADVMRLLLEIGKDAGPDRAGRSGRPRRSWRARRRFPGFGHRVYHTEDPRATHLRQMSRELGQRAGSPSGSRCRSASRRSSRPRRS